MSGHGTSNFQPNSKVVRWIDSRLPLFSLANEQAIEFPTPKNLNYMWTFGAILMFMLITRAKIRLRRYINTPPLRCKSCPQVIGS